MAYSDILLHLDNSARSDVRISLAIELALRLGAHLTGVYVLDLPSPTMFMGGTSVFDMRMADEILSQARDYALEASHVVQARFEEALRKNSVEGEWRLVDGLAAETAALHGRYADLVIVGQSDPEHLVRSPLFILPINFTR
jgi:nucleotide-binding universal stress UspA family protein